MSFNATNVDWAQPTEETLEIRVPVILPFGTRAKELSVAIADGEVVVVKMKDTTLWQCRLHAAVERDIEWYVDNDSTLVLDVTKKVSGRWPGLLNFPMKKDDSNLMTLQQLDEFIAKELPPLPPLPKSNTTEKEDKTEEIENKENDEEKKEEVTAEEEDAPKVENDVKEDANTDDSRDLDMLLEEAVEEIVDPKKAEKGDKPDSEVKTPEALSVHHEAELKGIEMETKAILSKMEELEETLKKSEEGSDEQTTTKKQLILTGKMLEVVQLSRELRSEVTTVDNFIKILKLDLSKSRINIGILEPSETEEYQTEAEKTMEGHDLFLAGMQALETAPVEGVHLLRLAAIHKAHTPSVIALFSIYSNVPASYVRGASLLLESATREEVDMKSNSKVGDLFCAGARSFPPVWSMAVYFHQRAAALGSVHSLVSLANLYHRGECFGNSFMPESLRKDTQSTDRMKYFVDCAIERGSVAGYLQRSYHLTEGIGGVEKDIKEAKRYFDRACNVEPSIKTALSAEVSLGVTIKDLQTRIQEGTGAVKKSNDDDIVDLRLAPSEESKAESVNKRLVRFENAPENRAMPSASNVKKGGAAGGAKARSRWEAGVRLGITCYALYALAFPIRVIMLPVFNEKLEALIQSFGLQFLLKA